MPRVSVVITTVGRETLSKAIASVREQTYKDYELIVIDDSDRKLGGAKALNKGLDEATGQYIAILDDDDEWTGKDKLERQVKFLDENPDYIAVGTNPQPGQGEEIKINLIGTPFPHSSMMFHRGLRYNEKLPRAKDLDLMLRLSKLGKLGVIKDCDTYIGHTVNCVDDLDKKIKDCHYHRKVIITHREFPYTIRTYLRLWRREIRLRYYKIKNYVDTI